MIVPYIISILILVSIYIILGLSLNLALGYSGLLNLGQAALFGIGAYTSALLNLAGVPFLISFICAGIVSGIFGYFLVFATRNLKGDYYALASLGFSFVVYSLLLNFVFLTKGPFGITGIPRPNIFGFVFEHNLSFLIFSSLIAVLSIFCIDKIVKSGFGKILEAMRDDETQLRILGKDTLKLKYKVMFISGFFAGVSGSLFAHYIGFIEPNSFYINEIVLILTIVIIGGIASVRGTVLSAFLIVALSEFLRFIPLPSSIVGPGRQIIYALILIIILMYRPRGLYGRIDLG